MGRQLRRREPRPPARGRRLAGLPRELARPPAVPPRDARPRRRRVLVFFLGRDGGAGPPRDGGPRAPRRERDARVLRGALPGHDARDGRPRGERDAGRPGRRRRAPGARGHPGRGRLRQLDGARRCGGLALRAPPGDVRHVDLGRGPRGRARALRLAPGLRGVPRGALRHRGLQGQKQLQRDRPRPASHSPSDFPRDRNRVVVVRSSSATSSATRISRGRPGATSTTSRRWSGPTRRRCAATTSGPRR